MTRFRGLMVLVLWQAAPVGVDDHGRTRLGFGIGGGALEYSVVSCEGDVVESGSVGYKHAAAEVEHWVTPNSVRLHASGGYQWSDSISANGPFGTFMIGYEGRRFGIGGGIAFVPSADEAVDFGVPGDRFSITKTSGSVGLGVVGSIDEEGSTGVVGDLFHPISPSVLFGAHAYASPGRLSPQFGLTAGIKVQLR